MNITVNAFRRQLDWLKAHGEIVDLEEAITRRGEPESHRLFALTFDDGYADVFTHAFPILRRRQLPFTLYLTSGPIANPAAFPEWPGRPLSWGQVRSMIESDLVTVGAHTHTHADLRQIPERAIAEELDRSNALIAERTAVNPAHFTYPKGWWAPAAHEAVRSRYRTATVGSGPGITAKSDIHLLHRIPVQRSDAGPLFGSKIRTGARVEDRLRRLMHGYEGR